MTPSSRSPTAAASSARPVNVRQENQKVLPGQSGGALLLGALLAQAQRSVLGDAISRLLQLLS